jgi:peptidoglycan/LPS O-acetylase OafA/YrhL
MPLAISSDLTVGPSSLPVSNARYRLLDAWRGVAALGVLGFHTVNNLVDPGRGWVTTLLWHGWAGVYIFFPISGYCILAASHSSLNDSAGRFLRRRWRRIFPTYWASIAVVVVLAIVFAPFSRRSLWALAEPGVKWLSILSLTQTLAGLPQVINPVYWSLCYEEQFYLLIAGTMLCAASFRPAILLAVTALTTVTYCLGLGSSLPTGVFIDHWLEFAVGLAVFGWFDDRYGRAWAGAMFGLAALAEAATWRADLAISLTTALLIVALRPYDRSLSSLQPIRWLGAVGAISYSLYLTHVPIAGRIVSLARRLVPGAADWWPIVTVVSFTVSIAFAAVFYSLVERRFQNSRVSPRPADQPDVMVA